MREIASNIATIGASDLFTRGMLFLYSVLASRLLTKEDFGLFALSVSLGAYSWAVTDGGITGHSTRMIATSQKDFWPTVIGRAIITRLVLTGLLACLIGLFLLISSISGYEAAILCSSIIFAAAVAIFPGWIMRGGQDNIGYAQSYALPAIALGVGTIGLFWLHGSTTNGLAAIILRNTSWLIGSLLALLWVIRRHSVDFRIRDFRFEVALLRRTFPLGAAAMCYTLLPLIPQLAIRFVEMPSDLALYGAAWTLQQILVAGAGIVAAGLTPMLARQLSEKSPAKEILQPHFFVVAGLATIVAAGLYIFGERIYWSLFGGKYDAAVELLLPFSLALWFVFFRVSIDAVNISIGNYKYMIITGVVIAIAAILSAAVLAPRGFVVLGWVYCGSEACLLVMNWMIAIRGLAVATTFSPPIT